MEACPTIHLVPGDLCTADFTAMRAKLRKVFCLLLLTFGIALTGTLAAHAASIFSTGEQNQNQIAD